MGSNEEDKKNYSKKAIDGTSLVFTINGFVFLRKNGIYIIQGFDVYLNTKAIETVKLYWGY